MNQKLLDAFKTLELSPESSREELRLAYRDLIQVWHPDKHYSNDRLREKASEKLKEINRAYDILREYYRGDADHADNGKNRPKQDSNPEDQYILQACLKPECSAVNRVPRGKNPQQAKCGQCGRPLERAAYEEFEYRMHSEKQDLLDRETKARVRQAEELRKLIQQKERERRERDKRVALEQQNRAAREKQKQEACEQAANKEEIRRLVVEELRKNELNRRRQAARSRQIHGRLLATIRVMTIPMALFVCLVGSVAEEEPRSSNTEIAHVAEITSLEESDSLRTNDRLKKRKAATEKSGRRLEGFNFRDDVVVDQRTGLMWARNADLAKEKMDWDHARQWLRSLEVGGYRNWRLPTRNELEGLCRRGGTNPAGYYNGLGFTSVQPDWYWASSKDALDNRSAWVVSMGYGYVSRCNKGDCNQVWPVREQ